VRDDEHLARAAPVDRGRQPRARARKQRVVALEVGRRAARREVARPAVFDLRAREPAPGADVPLAKARLFPHRFDAEVGGDQVGRAPGPDEIRRPYRGDRGDLGEPHGGVLGLLFPEG
jgi:hypothetical protein